MSKKVVLKASAGTGKTYRLSLEYISALLKGENYKNILVMTFTKKATAEIGERVLEFLECLSSESKDEKKIEENNSLKKSLLNLYEDLDLSRENILKTSKEVLENSDSIKIYTIDGFINKIFKNVIAPFLEMEAYSLIDLDGEEEVVETLLEKIFSNKKSFEIFKGFLDENIEKNLDNYTSLLKTILNERWKYILLKESQKMGKISCKQSIPFNKEDSRTSVEILNLISQEIEEISKIKGKERDYYLSTFAKNYFEKDSYAKNSFVEENLFILLEKNIWDGRYTRGKETVEIVEEMLHLTEILREKIVTEIYNSKMLPYENQVLGFIEELYRTYDEIKIKEGKLTFNDISTYTYIHYKNPELNLFEGEKITEYFQEIFDSKFKVFFIDEFQDTSILQWKLLSGIAEISETAFFVGDEKQSLYSWRGGEKELFEKLSKIILGSEENLETCYRSKKNIVDFTNKIFRNISKIYSEKEINFKSEWHFTDVKAIKNENSYIEIIDLTVEKKAEENENYLDRVINILKENFNGDYRDIAIIGRTSKELEEIGIRLSDNSIPYTLRSNSNIFMHRANISIYRLLKYFVLDDYFSLLEFLRGDLIKLKIDSLKYLLTSKKQIESYLNSKDLENCYLEIVNLEKEEQLQLDKLLKKIKTFKNLYNDFQGEVEPFIVQIFKTFGTMGMYKSLGDIKNYYRFLEICKSFETVSELVKAGETNGNNPMFSQVSVEDKNAITLITIHASKGLEYNTVFFLHNPKKNPPDKNKMSFNVQLDEEYRYLKDFLILNNSHKKTLETKSVLERYEFISKKEIKKIQEDINGWYVALTRAKQNLFIILAGEKENSILKQALIGLESSVGEFKRELIMSEENKIENKIEKLDLSQIDLSPILIDKETLQENLILQSEQLKNTEVENEKNLLMGTAVHYFLENIDYLEKKELEKAKIKTLSKYGVELGFEKLENIFKSEKFIKSLEKYSEVFSKDWDFIHKEYEVKLNGKLKIIDRMMIKTFKEEEIGEIQIIDYKTGKREQEQLNEYEKAIFEILLSQELEKKYKITSKFITVEI